MLGELALIRWRYVAGRCRRHRGAAVVKKKNQRKRNKLTWWVGVDKPDRRGANYLRRRAELGVLVAIGGGHVVVAAGAGRGRRHRRHRR